MAILLVQDRLANIIIHSSGAFDDILMSLCACVMFLMYHHGRDILARFGFKMFD